MASSTLRSLLLLFLIAAMLLRPVSDPSLSAGGVTPYEAFLAADPGQDLYTGGTIEKIRVVEYATIEDALDAVSSGGADLFGHEVNESDYSLVDSYSNLKLQWAHTTRAYAIVMNAEHSPLNNIHLRRAMAYAVNKTYVADTVMNGTVTEADFTLSPNSEYEIESTEGGQFYNMDLASARYELELAGMLDVDEDGLVEGPDGGEVAFPITYPSDIDRMNATAFALSSDLLTAGINNTILSMPYADLQEGLENHTLDYWIALYEMDFPLYEPGWGFLSLQSSLVTEVGQNVVRLDDAQIDAAVAAYLDTLDLDSVGDVIQHALRLVRDRCPVIPLFFYNWLSVYSDQRLSGWVDDSTGGALSVWNPVSVVAKESEENEFVVAVLPEFFDQFFTSLNLFMSTQTITTDWIYRHHFNPYMLLYDSPTANSLDGAPIPRASTSWVVLYSGAASDLTASQTRPEFYCDSNAVWSDGIPMNAQDYKYTLELYCNHSLLEFSSKMAYVKVVGNYRVGPTLNDMSLFNFRSIGMAPILPKHIWEGKNVTSWYPEVDESIGSGPYTVSVFQPGESLEMSINSLYYPEPDVEAPSLMSFKIDPADPAPVDGVVFQVVVSDRSRIANLTLSWTYVVGDLRFNDSDPMIFTTYGYTGTIPGRITADAVLYNITACDIWGNVGVVTYGNYSKVTNAAPDFWASNRLVFIGLGAAAIIAFVLVVRRR